MPDATGRLSAEEKTHVARWLQQRGHHHACAVCGHHKYMIADHLIAARIHAEDPRTIADETYPQVALVCNHCAHVKYFMAVPMGIGFRHEG